MGLNISEEDLAELTDADIAALAARDKWLDEARPKQIPPQGDWTQAIWKAGRGFGKVLSLDTPIPTPSGWTTMGEIKVGDQVFDESGRPCSVTFVSQVQAEPTYAMRFSDGSELITGLSHQWVTWTHAERKSFLRSPYEDTARFPEEWPAWRLKRHRGRQFQHLPKEPQVSETSPGPKIRTTGEIIATLTHGKRGDRNHCIPQARALVLPDADLIVPPYTFGAWLGDGASGGGSFYAHEDDMPFLRRQIESDGFETRARKDTQAFGILALHPLLRQLGVLNNKHMPSAYLRASAPQRLALLRGLMDTDGGVDFANSCSFTNCNKGLVDAVYELLMSLGMKATRDDRIPMCQNGPGERAYRVTFSPTIQVFTMPRKANQLIFSGAQALRRHHRMIVSVDKVEDVPLCCISVDGTHAMYLAGRSMIPTHNTKTITEWGWWEGWRTGAPLIGHAVGPTLGDVKGTLMKGVSGFQAAIPAECLYRGSWEHAYVESPQPTLKLSCGTIIRGFGAQEQAARLRGPQCHFAVGDELREWDRPAGNLESAHSNLMFGVRLPYPDGSPARAVFATTPKAIPYLRMLYKQPGVITIEGTTHENLKNLNAAFKNTILAKEGTKIGRVEIYAEEQDDVDGIYKKSWVRLWPPFKKLPEFTYIVQSMDTAFEEEQSREVKKGKEPDFSACSILGIFNTRQCFSEEELKRLKVKSKYAALLCDFWMDRLAFPDLLEAARKSYRTKWGQPGRRPDLALIENKASGISLRQTLITYGVPTWPFEPRGQSKTMRAHAASPLVLQGMLFMPESGLDDRRGQVRDWAEPLLDQMTQFAGEGTIEFDDGLDTIVQAMLHLQEKGYFHAEPQGRQYPDLDEKEEQEQKLARQISDKEKRQKAGNPYDS